jgi:hypothetical protein
MRRRSFGLLAAALTAAAAAALTGAAATALTQPVAGAPVEAASTTGTPAARCPHQASMALDARGSAICVFIDARTPAARRAQLQVWIERSARIVTDYYARFPAPLVTLRIRSLPGAGVRGGRTTNDSGLLIDVGVGSETSADELADDWVLVHEMVHLALPEIGRRHNWLAEGLATYVEGVARAQFGNRDISDVWAEDRHSMPLGLPHPGEGGMDQTPTWGRTYWGGALYCLRSDVAIRERTQNRAGLQTALRAILDETGGYGSTRDIDDVLRIGDAATGTRVLQELYAQIKEAPAPMDLDLMWSRLGVPADPKTQPFDDQAPLAAIRIAITARKN